MLKYQRERERERESYSPLGCNYRKGGHAVGLAVPSMISRKGGQRYSLIGGDSYGC